MTFQILSDPSTNHGSRWSALFNPIVFEYQLQEYAIAEMNYNPLDNNIEIGLAAQLSSTELPLVHTGNPVYVQTSQYQFTLPSNGAGYISDDNHNTLLSFKVPNAGTAVDGFVNVLAGVPGLKFRTEITWGYDGAANVFTVDHTPNLKGYCRADISKYLRQLLSPTDAFAYNSINYRDANLSASYTVRVQLVWQGGSSAWQIITNPFYVTYSAMQIGNPTGGNMQPFVTQSTANQAYPAHFLNDFSIPHLYTDMPFDISFIYSENIAGLQIQLGGNGADVNGQSTGALGAVYLLNENGSVLLNQDGSKLLIEKAGPLTLYNKLGVNRLMLSQSAPLGSYYADIYLFYIDNNGNNIRITETKRLLLDNAPCNGLPYEYLKWMGPSGGWLYYLFSTNQIHEVNATNPVITNLFIADYAKADSTQQLLSINAQKAITLGANDLPAAEIEVLATLLYAPKVYRLVDAPSNTWQGVMVDTKSLKLYQTYGNTGDFELKILLPDVNTMGV